MEHIQLGKVCFSWEINTLFNELQKELLCSTKEESDMMDVGKAAYKYSHLSLDSKAQDYVTLLNDTGSVSSSNKKPY